MSPVLLSDVLEENGRRGMRATCRVILRELMCFGTVTRDRLVAQLYTDEDGGPLWAERSVDVHVSLLRERLRMNWHIGSADRGAWTLERLF